MTMLWDATTIIQLIEQGVVLIPKFAQLWANIKGTFSTDDAAAVDAALQAAILQDAKDTAQADIDLAAAAKRT